MPEPIPRHSIDTGTARIRDELWKLLSPFPGRGQRTLRLAILSTVVVLVSNTFRLPSQDLMPFFLLFITKEEKVTTTISALVVLVTLTLAIGLSILLFKLTGNRAEFRVPAIAVEIFVGMYLFRIVAIGSIGWILGFICAASQSIVYLFPSPEVTVHQFLWLWVAVAFPIGLAWISSFLLFPVSAIRLLQQGSVHSWDTVSEASTQLISRSPATAEAALEPLVKSGPTPFLKLLKLSSIESPRLKNKQSALKRLILIADKIARLLFSYARAQRTVFAGIPAPSADTPLLTELQQRALFFERQFRDGFVPSHFPPIASDQKRAGFPSVQLLEAERSVDDLAEFDKDPETSPEKAAAKAKHSLLVADAFSNPRHVQFALKVTLAGMIGYLFYTASNYYGIHTVFYTPLIIALASSGATIHKGILRILGCMIGGVLGLLCSVWVIPRFETLGTFLLIVFCVHAFAAYIAFGSERIAYVGLQIALAFDLGFLQSYGPPDSIDPFRDRFLGIVIGIAISGAIFSLLWPESAGSLARDRLAAALNGMAKLLRLRPSDPDFRIHLIERERTELEIVSRLSDANSYVEQVGFESLLYTRARMEWPRLQDAAWAVEELYVSSLAWIRERTSLEDSSGEKSKAPDDLSQQFAQTLNVLADGVQHSTKQSATSASTAKGRLRPNEYLVEGIPTSGAGGQFIRAATALAKL